MFLDFIPVSQIERILDGMSLLKLNVLHWHIIDSQSFPFQSRKHPNISTHGAFHPVHAIYSFDDIKRIVAYAFLRGIEIIPEIDVPGRMLLHTTIIDDFN